MNKELLCKCGEKFKVPFWEQAYEGIATCTVCTETRNSRTKYPQDLVLGDPIAKIMSQYGKSRHYGHYDDYLEKGHHDSEM